MQYEAGIFALNGGSTHVLRPHGDPASDTGDKSLALAQRDSDPDVVSYLL